MPDLFPEDVMESLEDEEENEYSEEEETEDEEETIYRKSVYFDDILGDLRRDGSKKIIESTETEAFEQWCVKVLRTPRFQCLAYSDDIGIDIEEVFSTSDRDYAESILTNEITEALMADPYNRTELVDSIEYDWISPDSVHVSVTVSSTYGEQLVIEADIENE